MNGLWNDVKFGFRMIVKNPGYALIVVLTLAVGIGANTTVFSFVNGVLFKPLPYPDIDRILYLEETSPEFDSMAVSAPNFIDWVDMNQSFDPLGAFRFTTMNLSGIEFPERVKAGQVTSSFFTVMGAKTIYGRLFRQDEDQPSSARTAVLSAKLWKEKFKGSEDVIGKSVRLHEHVYTVVGVMDPGFSFPPYGLDAVDVWIPLGLFYETPEFASRGNHAGIYAIGKLKQGVPIERAKADFDAVAAHLANEYPDTNASNGVRFHTLQERMFEDIHPEMLAVLLAAVGFVLLIACANVSNLMLAKSTARTQEISVRAALGANRWRIVRQLLSEMVCVAVLGTGFGILFSIWGMDWLMSLIPERIQGIREAFSLDWRVLGYTTFISLFTVVMFGLAPALHVSGARIQDALKVRERVGGSMRSNRLRNLLIAGELCAALVLLCGSGLMIRSFINLLNGDTGIDAQNVLSVSLSLPREKYSGDAEIRAFYDGALNEIHTLPGVRTAAAVSPTPFFGMALGAGIGDVVWMVLGQGMRVILAGIGVGLVVSIGLTQLMKSMLFQVSAFDPLTFGIVTLVLVGTAALAAILPAWRAAKADPMAALRQE